MAERLGIAVNLHAPKAPISQYWNHEYNSICTGPNGEVLGAGPEGIDSLWSADTDNGSKIVATITTQLMDMGSPVAKRIPFLYLYGESDGRLRIQAKRDETGVRTVDAANIPSTQGGQRVAFGSEKGRYWQFTITNPDGEDFSIDAIDAMPVYLER